MAYMVYTDSGCEPVHCQVCRTRVGYGLEASMTSMCVEDKA